MSKKMSNFAPDFERGRRAVSRIKKTPRQVKNRSCPGGGMVDAVDSKSAVSNGVRVQVPPGVQKEFCKHFLQRNLQNSFSFLSSIWPYFRIRHIKKVCLNWHTFFIKKCNSKSLIYSDIPLLKQAVYCNTGNAIGIFIQRVYWDWVPYRPVSCIFVWYIYSINIYQNELGTELGGK